MPQLSEIQGRFRYSIERFDGGLNTKDSPSRISPYESPDCLNVVFDNAGSVWCRDGTKIFNTTAVGGFAIDMGISYASAAVAWASGNMYIASNTTFVPVTSASGKFTAGRTIAAVIYQNVLFCSDGINGPYKYTGGENFYNMGIAIPSAPTGASSGAGSVSTGSYWYGISYVNTQVVEGQIGSSSAQVTTTASSTVRLTSIPVGTTIQGVNQRFVYRAEAASGPFRKVGTINDNTTTTFDDTTPNGAEGKLPILDGTSPTPFTTIESAKERLFFDDSSNRSLGRWTNFTNPYISEAENFEPFNNGDGESIVAITSQDNVVTFFKSNRNFSFQLQDPSDPTTWIKLENPANLGIVGPHAFDKTQDGIVFVGKQNNRITGVHFLNGLNVARVDDGKLRSLTLSQRIELEIFNDFNSGFWSNIFCKVYQNRLYLAYTPLVASSNSKMYWFDLNRIGTEGQPGSWAPWDGINAKCLFVHQGLLYSGDSTSTGFLRQFNSGSYSDSGSAINSYFWTKEIGGEEDGSLDGYIKDLRELYLWYAKLGSYNMNVSYRLDGDTGVGFPMPIDLTPGGNLWSNSALTPGALIWGQGNWGGSRSDFQIRIPIGKVIGRRFQFKFDNQKKVGQGFKVHRLEIGMNLRRRR